MNLAGPGGSNPQLPRALTMQVVCRAWGLAPSSFEMLAELLGATSVSRAQVSGIQGPGESGYQISNENCGLGASLT